MSDDKGQELVVHQDQTPATPNTVEVPVDYATLLRQTVNEARPVFLREARDFHTSGVRYTVDGPEVPDSPQMPEGAVFDPDATPGLFGKVKSQSATVPHLGHPEVTGLDTPDATRISYRTESGGKDFDIVVDANGIQVVGVTPQEAWQGLHVLTSGRVNQYGMFQYNPNTISLGSFEGVKHPTSPLSPADTLRQISAPEGK